MSLVIELNVFDASIGSADDTLIILVIHLGGNDRGVCLDTSYHIPVIWRQDLSVLVSISDHGALCSRNNHLRVTVDDTTNGLTKDEFFLSVLQPIELVDIIHVFWIRVDGGHSSISRT